MKTGIIDVGGGMRGIYAAGVFDRLIDDKVNFDLCIGISAGSANIASYTAGQNGRNLQFYAEYAIRKEYMSLGNFITTGSYIGLEYVYGTLSNSDGENPLDYKSFMDNPAEILVVATDAETGEPIYFGKKDIKKDDYRVLMASSAIPGVCRPIKIDGIHYFDGALGDTIPIEKAFRCGCERVVLILTKPAGELRTPGKDRLLAKMIEGKYPAAANKLRNRAEQYNRGIELAKEYEKDGRVLIVAPDDTCGVDTLTKDKNAMLKLYARGYNDGGSVREFVS